MRVCVCEREREREREIAKKTEKEMHESDIAIKNEFVCVRERETER